MKLFLVADTHGDTPDLSRMGEADYVVTLGDLGGHLAWDIKDRLREHPKLESRIFSILGNHDDPACAVNYPWMNYRSRREGVLESGGVRYPVLFLDFKEHWNRPVLPEGTGWIVFSHQPPVVFPDQDLFHEPPHAFREMLPFVTHWFCGHIHQRTETEEEGCRIRSIYGAELVEI